MPSFTRHFVEKDLEPRDLILVEGKCVLSASAYAYLLAFAYELVSIKGKEMLL